jgi:hypothetical protein
VTPLGACHASADGAKTVRIWRDYGQKTPKTH